MNLSKKLISISDQIDRILGGRERKTMVFKRIPVLVDNTDIRVLVMKSDHYNGYNLHFFTPMSEQEYLDWKPF